MSAAPALSALAPSRLKHHFSAAAPAEDAQPRSSFALSAVKAVAGTGAGIVSTTLCSPLDVAKTRIQVQTSIEGGARYSGIISSLVTIYREEGLRGWYHGFTPAVCSVAVFWTCYFPCYDYAKTSIAEASGLPMTSSLVHMSAAAGAGLLTDVITNPLPLWHIIAASGVSKLIASTITYPHEVIRARLQFDQGGQLYSGLLDATRKTLLHDGLAGLWLGFNLNIVRTIPQCVVTFTLYEYLSRRLQLAFGLTSEGLSEGRHPQQQKQIKMVTLARSESRG